MAIPQNTRNIIERPVLPGYSQFFQHLSASPEDKGISYTFDEFGWELGTYALRKVDADKVMAFLGELGRTIEAEEIITRFNPAQAPVVWLKGKKFSNAKAGIELGLRVNYRINVVSSSRAESKVLEVVPKQYESSEDYSAWERAIRLLSQKGETSLQEIKDSLLEHNLGMSLEGVAGVRFFANTDMNIRKIRDRIGIHIYDDYHLSLNEIFDRTITAIELVNEAYLVTERLPKLKNQRIDSLTARLIDNII